MEIIIKKAKGFAFLQMEKKLDIQKI